jgi:hypothetical protein
LSYPEPVEGIDAIRASAALEALSGMNYTNPVKGLQGTNLPRTGRFVYPMEPREQVGVGTIGVEVYSIPCSCVV